MAYTTTQVSYDTGQDMRYRQNPGDGMIQLDENLGASGSMPGSSVRPSFPAVRSSSSYTVPRQRPLPPGAYYLDSPQEHDFASPSPPSIGLNHRDSFGRNSIDDSSLHVVKRFPNPAGMRKKQRWTKHKWWLLLSNTLLFLYGLTGVVLALLTYFKLYLRADVIIVGEPLLLNLVISSGVICLATAFLGYAGIMLNNRGILTIYNLMLWPCFALIASIGYVSYRRAKWNLEGKLSQQWHNIFTPNDRARIQANLHCCGYKRFDDFPERSNRCFPRTLLPGCRYKYQQFIAAGLRIAWIVAFSLVPAHMLVIIVALMCSNHVNRKFGKGLPPKIYRLDYQEPQSTVVGTPTGSSTNVSRRPNSGRL